jgi:hypothetical protein
MVTPLWLLDYFVMNGFVDGKVYIRVDTPKGADTFTIDLDCLQDPTRSVSAFVSPHYMATFAFAEKGADSTTDVSPSQQHYRSAEEWLVYRRNLERIRQSTRPHLLRSTGNISLSEVAGGHLFIANDFTARDPQTEIKLSSLSSLQAENAKLSNQNAALEARALEAERTVQALQAEKLSNQNAALEARALEAERTVQALQAENAKLSNQNAALEARALEAERTVQAMLASTSWRITSALRAIKNLKSRPPR